MTTDSAPTESGGKVPAYRRIAATLGAEIEGGVLGPGSRLPAEMRLAARFRVSRGTLRQALQNLRDEGLLESVPGRAHYVARGTPRARHSRRKVVGVVVPSVAQPFVPDLLGWIEDELYQRGYSMIVGSSGWTREQQAGRIHRILDEGASGLIAYPIDYEPDPPLFRHLVERDLPVVLIDRYIIDVAVDAVLPDNVGGGFAAVSHLAKLGHRRIAFISTDNLSTTSVAERLQGYEQALRAHGIAAERSLVFAELPIRRRWPTGSPPHETADVSAIADFLGRERPSAAFTLHDNLAADTIVAAQRMGIRVAGDLAIVSFDDDPPVAALTTPLTLVVQPRELLGRTAARLVVERIEGRRTETARIILPTELIVRESSGSVVGVEATATG